MRCCANKTTDLVQALSLTCQIDRVDIEGVPQLFLITA